MEDLNLKGIVAETRKIVEDYIEPVVTVLEEPGTGVLRPVILVGEDRVDYPSPAVFDDYRDTPKRRLGVANLTKIESLSSSPSQSFAWITPLRRMICRPSCLLL